MAKFKLLLLIISVLAIFLRLFRLGENPPSVYWDEAAIGFDAYSLAHNGVSIDNHSWLQPVFGSYGDFKAPVMIWLSSIWVKIFGLSAFSLRLSNAIVGILTVFLSFSIFKEILKYSAFKKNSHYIALLGMAIIAISPWSVHFSRIGFESGISIGIFSLSLYFFLLSLKKSYFLIPSAFTAVLGCYSYYSLRVIYPALFVLLFLIFYRKLL